VDSAVAGGSYGYTLMWAMVIALSVRFVFVSVIAKYQLCNQHGESVVSGLKRLHPVLPASSRCSSVTSTARTWSRESARPPPGC